MDPKLKDLHDKRQEEDRYPRGVPVRDQGVAEVSTLYQSSDSLQRKMCGLKGILCDHMSHYSFQAETFFFLCYFGFVFVWRVIFFLFILFFF